MYLGSQVFQDASQFERRVSWDCFVMPLLAVFAAQLIAFPRIQSRNRGSTYPWNLFKVFDRIRRSLLPRQSDGMCNHCLQEVIAEDKLTYGIGFCILCLSTLGIFPPATMLSLCFPIIWLLGAAVGAIYVKVLDSAVEQ